MNLRIATILDRGAHQAPALDATFERDGVVLAMMFRGLGPPEDAHEAARLGLDAASAYLAGADLDDLERCLPEALDRANQAVFDAARLSEPLRALGTAALVGAQRGDQVVLCQVGDIDAWSVGPREARRLVLADERALGRSRRVRLTASTLDLGPDQSIVLGPTEPPERDTLASTGPSPPQPPTGPQVQDPDPQALASPRVSSIVPDPVCAASAQVPAQAAPPDGNAPHAEPWPEPTPDAAPWPEPEPVHTDPTPIPAALQPASDVDHQVLQRLRAASVPPPKVHWSRRWQRAAGAMGVLGAVIVGGLLTARAMGPREKVPPAQGAVAVVPEYTSPIYLVAGSLDRTKADDELMHIRFAPLPRSSSHGQEFSRPTSSPHWRIRINEQQQPGCRHVERVIDEALKESPDNIALYLDLFMCFQREREALQTGVRTQGQLDALEQRLGNVRDPNLARWQQPAIDGVERRLDLFHNHSVRAYPELGFSDVVTDSIDPYALAATFAQDVGVEMAVIQAYSEIVRPTDRQIASLARRVHAVRFHVDSEVGRLIALRSWPRGNDALRKELAQATNDFERIHDERQATWMAVHSAYPASAFPWRALADELGVPQPVAEAILVARREVRLADR